MDTRINPEKTPIIDVFIFGDIERTGFVHFGQIAWAQPFRTMDDYVDKLIPRVTNAIREWETIGLIVPPELIFQRVVNRTVVYRFITIKPENAWMVKDQKEREFIFPQLYYEDLTPKYKPNCFVPKPVNNG